MGRPFGLGLRSQLMLALIVAFGAAFVLLSLVTARLDESEDAEQQRLQAQALAEAFAAAADVDGSGLHRCATSSASIRNGGDLA